MSYQEKPFKKGDVISSETFKKYEKPVETYAGEKAVDSLDRVLFRLPSKIGKWIAENW